MHARLRRLADRYHWTPEVINRTPLVVLQLYEGRGRERPTFRTHAEAEAYLKTLKR